MSLMVVYPLDQARTRLLFKLLEDPGAPPYSISAVRDELRLIVRESGYTGLYTGFTVSVLGIVAYRGPYFALSTTFSSRPTRGRRTRAARA